jgi:hypothetical protein
MFQNSPKGGVIVKMLVESSPSLFARPVWRDASPGGLCIIIDVIFAVVIGARPVGRVSRSHLGIFVFVEVEVKSVVP